MRPVPATAVDGAPPGTESNARSPRQAVPETELSEDQLFTDPFEKGPVSAR